MTKQMRGQERNGEWKRKNKKNEARKKECKRQLERKLRLETATRRLRRRTKKEKKSGDDCSYRTAQVRHGDRGRKKTKTEEDGS